MVEEEIPIESGDLVNMERPSLVEIEARTKVRKQIYFEDTIGKETPMLMDDVDDCVSEDKDDLLDEQGD
ncbi:conserved hypothetical protein [Ricinus communis]|uniref:Uncharacterized protein n=1 Tax=Ricinus communis TaxID=3988 RepID=B9RX20_RICCO|nr:conserved hypothetical protein [Ricinus communis]